MDVLLFSYQKEEIIAFEERLHELFCTALSLVMIMLGLVTIFKFVTIISLLFIVAAIWILWPIVIGAQWIPTPNNVVEKMLYFAEVGPDDILIDLGSGDGRIILMAALKFGANAVGIEADPLRVLITKIRIRLKGLKDQVDVIWGNFFRRISVPPQSSQSIKTRISTTS